MTFDNISDRVVRVRGARFAENGAGTYNYDVFVPAGALILDIVISAEVLWAAATSAAMVVGDYAASIVNGSPVIGSAITSNGFFLSTNLKATDLTAGQSISFAAPGGKQGGNVQFEDPTAASLAAGSDIHVSARGSAVDRIVRFSVTSVGAGTAGRTSVAILILPKAQITDITQ